MKMLCITLALMVSVPALAHDEGHGPKLTDAAKLGGVVSPVIDAREASKGAKAAVLHKAELVRSGDGTVRVYFYDQGMNPLDLKRFSSEAKGILEFKKSKKWMKAPFIFKQEGNAFVGVSPKTDSKPFNIDIHVQEAGKELLAAFDNLD